MAIGLQTYAQSENALDADSEEILRNVSEKYKQYDGIVMEIDYSIQYPEEAPIESTVQVWLKGDKYVIQMGYQMIFTDNVTVWNYLSAYKELQISEYNEEEEVIKPSQIFDVYSDDYLYRVKEEYTLAGDLVKVVELTPVFKDQELFKIDLTVNIAKNEIISTKFYEKNGLRYSYSIVSFKEDKSLTDGFFTFDREKYPVVDEVDLR